MPHPLVPPAEVVIVGAGFAGLEVAKRLRQETDAGRLRVTMIDRHNHHVFQPLLYQVATAALDPQSIGLSIRSLLPQGPNLRFRLGEVVFVDPTRRRLSLADGSELAYDHLVIATGAEPSDHGVRGVNDHAFTLATLGDARRLRNHLLRRFEAVASETAGTESLHVVVCGGGPTGVELAGGLAELTHEVLARDFGFASAPIRITLLQRSVRLLPSFHPSSSRYAQCALERRGVSVHTGVGVSEVGPDRVVLDTGEVLRACTVVWCAGVRASSLALTAGLHVDRSGRTPVHGDLSVPAAPDTYVIGDAAGAVDGSSHPQLATVAIQQGAHVADQIRSRVAGGDTAPFHYRSVGKWATIGRDLAVVELAGGRVRLRGRSAWLLWCLAHLLRLAGPRNRASVALDWAWHYLTHDRAARLILDDQPRRDAPSPHSHQNA